MMPIIHGQLYRAWVRVPTEYVRALRAAYGDAGQKAMLTDVRRRMLRLGFSETLLATQDPTNNDLVSVIARRGPGPILLDDTIRIVSAEPVEEPPANVAKAEFPLFDSGLAADETMAIEKSLLHDRNARHLAGLASTLEPAFPSAASLLRAKANLIENRVLMAEPNSRRLLARALQAPLPKQVEAIAQARAAFEAAVSKTKVPLSVIRDGVRSAVASLLDNPNDPLTQHPAPVQALAHAMITDPVEFSSTGSRGRTDHLALVLPASARLALPPHPDDGFISPSALQLILAHQKPEWSKASSAHKAQQVVGALETHAKRVRQPFQYSRAKNQIERAVKGIDRRRWVEWYRRQDGHDLANGSTGRR